MHAAVRAVHAPARRARAPRARRRSELATRHVVPASGRATPAGSAVTLATRRIPPDLVVEAPGERLGPAAVPWPSIRLVMLTGRGGFAARRRRRVASVAACPGEPVHGGLRGDVDAVTAGQVDERDVQLHDTAGRVGSGPVCDRRGARRRAWLGPCAQRQAVCMDSSAAAPVRSRSWARSLYLGTGCKPYSGGPCIRMTGSVGAR